MTLFWHNHFATGYTKIAGALGAAEGARVSGGQGVRGSRPGARPDRDAARQRARQLPDILLAIAKDTAMLVWLDGRTNTKAQAAGELRPRDHGAVHGRRRQLHRGRRLRRARACSPAGTCSGRAPRPTARSTTSSSTTPASTTPPRRRSAFAIYPDGSKTIPARSAADGMQDGIDFINGSPRTRTPRAISRRKLYRFFVSEFGAVNVDVRQPRRRRSTCRASGDMKAVMREVLLSPEFWDAGAYFARYSWPVEFVVRALKDVGWTRLLGQRRADAAVEHGADPVRAARRQRLGRRARPGSRPARCWRA